LCYKEIIMSDRNLIGRRQFLVFSSTAALATATLGPRLFAGEGAAPRRLAFGFASFDGEAVRDAAAISASDGGFISRGARVVISGVSGTFANPSERRAVELLAHFSYMDGGERLSAPFRAWGSNRVNGSQGNSVRFNVPVDEVQKISLSLGVERGAATSAPQQSSRRNMVDSKSQQVEGFPITLSLQNEPGTLKLARGYYVIVPLFDGDSDPRWSSWTLRAVQGRVQLVDGAGNSAPFEHFVLKTDYATP
jgi:hypothetical protein